MHQSLVALVRYRVIDRGAGSIALLAVLMSTHTLQEDDHGDLA